MNEILAEFWAQLIPILVNLVVVVAGSAASFAGWKASQFFSDKLKRSIVEAAVRAVEQIGKELKSEEKFALAREKVIAGLKKVGIKLSDDELQLLIESTVQKFLSHYNAGAPTEEVK